MISLQINTLKVDKAINWNWKDNFYGRDNIWQANDVEK